MMITINYLIINYPTPLSIKIRSIGYKYVNVQIYKCLLQNYLIECSHFLGNYLSIHTGTIYREKSKTFKLFWIFNRRFSYFINRQNFYITYYFNFARMPKLLARKKKVVLQPIRKQLRVALRGTSFTCRKSRRSDMLLSVR